MEDKAMEHIFNQGPEKHARNKKQWKPILVNRQGIFCTRKKRERKRELIS